MASCTFFLLFSSRGIMIEAATSSPSSLLISLQRSSASSMFLCFSSMILHHLRSLSKCLITSCHDFLLSSFFLMSNKIRASNLKNGFVPKMISSSSSPSFFYSSTFQEIYLSCTMLFFCNGRITQFIKYLCIYGQSSTSSGSNSPNRERP